MLYKWIYDNLYPKDNSLLLGAVKKFCEKIGYTPDNMDEFVRFLTNFDFVSPYDEIFNSPSYISQLYKYLEKQYSSRFSNYKDYIVSRVDRLYNSDKYIRDKFKTFLFSYFFEDKRPAFDLSFDLFKTKKPEENSEEYLSKIERLSLGEVKQYFYNWLTLVAFFEFDLRWVYSTLKWLVFKAISNVDAHGLQSQDKIFENELEPYKWLD
ncbi:MAG: hypothetical protein N3D73_03070, partial [Candidatus Diapherotrites archaeon]|nr:hypothetical protein [Candidatus Diapherotrites archaeon]